MTKLALIAALTIGAQSQPAKADFAEALRSLGSMSFGTDNRFDVKQNNGNRARWEQRDSYVGSAMRKADEAMSSIDRSGIPRLEAYLVTVLKITWNTAAIQEERNQGILNAHGKVREFLKNYSDVQYNLIKSIADLSSNYKIIQQADPRQNGGMFSLDSRQVQTYTQRAAGRIDQAAAATLLYNNAGAVEKYATDMMNAVTYGGLLETELRNEILRQARISASDLDQLLVQAIRR